MKRAALWVFIILYIAYFATFSILRYRHLYAQYFDLGIMHQTVYNTYQFLKTGNIGRILELTTPHGGTAQIKRMAIHNDIILAFLAPFYFIYSGPETILFIQTIVLAFGALAVYKIAMFRFRNDWLSIVLSFAYLMYSPMQWANIFEFHAVTFATCFIVWMFYFWLKGNTKMSFLFVILTLFTKEEVGMTVAMFGLYTGLIQIASWKKTGVRLGNLVFPFSVFVVSVVWCLLSVFIIIPYFNGGEHFATGYYSNVRETFMQSIFNSNTVAYMIALLGPIAFVSLAAPEFILLAAPEFAINLLSSNLQLRSLNFHYTSAIQPWIFIGAIYGVQRILQLRIKKSAVFVGLFIITATLIFNYNNSPLPYSPTKYIDPWLYDRAGEYEVVHEWSERLSSDSIKVSSTDEIGPFFTSRRYFYIFSQDYTAADYVIVSLGNIQYTYRKDIEQPAYEKLKTDPNFVQVDARNGYEVYKKRTVSF